jgi:3-oxoacyl-[acyl-carrier protein] reductase
LTLDFPEGWKEKLRAKIGMGRFGSVEEVADVALLLASNRYMTGSTITVDGGMLYQ